MKKHCFMAAVLMCLCFLMAACSSDNNLIRDRTDEFAK